MCATRRARTTRDPAMQAVEHQPFSTRLAKPAAWRLSVAPPCEPSEVASCREHEHLISAGVASFDGLADVAVTTLDAAALGRWERAAVHEHDASELNILLPTTSLVCEVILGDERHEVQGPASIVVPAGL